MKSYYGANAALTAALANANRLALYSVAPGVSTSGTELSGSAYARQAVTFSAPTSGATANSVEVTFPTASANWASIVAVALVDVSGNIYYAQTLGTPISISAGQYLRVPIGGLTVTES